MTAFVAIAGAMTLASCAWHRHHEPADQETWNASRMHDGAGTLDGQCFDVTMSEVGHSNSDSELVEFHGGRFHSEGCDVYGFATGPYSSTKTGDAIAFYSDTSSAQEGAIHWQGTVRGDTIDGRFTWSKPGQTPRDYTFHGTRKTS